MTRVTSEKVALIGAGGKMGLRLTDNLKDSKHDVRYVEIAEAGKAALASRGVQVSSAEAALEGARIVILAVPDNLIGKVSAGLDPLIEEGAMVITLDPAAPFAGLLPDRPDLVYFVTHPCHPPVFSPENDPEDRKDFFGGIRARQHIVCALLQGPDEAYKRGEAIAREFYAPVMNAHRVTVEQMAILEPAMSETVVASCIAMCKEAMDEAIRRGVPAEAARDFILGHINIDLAILFGELEGAVFSDGAQKAMQKAQKDLFQPDWKKVFEKDAVWQSIRDITTA